MHQRPISSLRIPRPIYRLIVCIFILSSFVTSKTLAQSEFGVGTIEQWFDRSIGIENSGLINGPEYKIELLSPTSDPFLISNAGLSTVVYDRQIFVAPLLYDIYKDALVVKHVSKEGRPWFIELNKALVQEFKISERTFRNFENSFHEVLFEGSDFYFVSKISKTAALKKGRINYIQNQRFFIIEGKEWKSLTVKASFNKLLVTKAQKVALKSFIRQHPIRIRKSKADDFAKIGGFIDSLRQKARK